MTSGLAVAWPVSSKWAMLSEFETSIVLALISYRVHVWQKPLDNMFRMGQLRCLHQKNER